MPRQPALATADLLRLATYASTATALLLIAVKLAAWVMTGSLSVMASLVDSLMDAAASLINLLAVRYSLKSPDADHQFGHGKAEALAGLGQASFICGSALFLLMQTAERLRHPQPLKAVGVGIGVMAFAIIATLLLLAFQTYVIKRTGSTAIKADALHYKTDLLTNAFFVSAGWPLLDPLCAAGIAAYILRSAWQIGQEAMQVLMDRELPDTTRQAICDLALSHALVLGIHDLRTRQAGQVMHIQLHLDLDSAGADIIIHQDPSDPAQYHGQRRECL